MKSEDGMKSQGHHVSNEQGNIVLGRTRDNCSLNPESQSPCLVKIGEKNYFELLASNATRKNLWHEENCFHFQVISKD